MLRKSMRWSAPDRWDPAASAPPNLQLYGLQSLLTRTASDRRTRWRGLDRMAEGRDRPRRPDLRVRSVSLGKGCPPLRVPSEREDHARVPAQRAVPSEMRSV